MSGLFRFLVGASVSLVAATSATPTRVLVAWHSETNRTLGLAELLIASLHSTDDVDVRSKPVDEVTCDDMLWYHGILLGSPVYWGMYSGVLKTFLDNVQQRCFGWPVTELRWKVGGAFCTGAHVASGKEATLNAIHTFFASVQMISVANEPPAACLLGACATNRNESAAEPSFTEAEKTDAHTLAQRVVTLSRQMRSLIDAKSDGEVSHAATVPVRMDD